MARALCCLSRRSITRERVPRFCSEVSGSQCQHESREGTQQPQVALLLPEGRPGERGREGKYSSGIVTPALSVSEEVFAPGSPTRLRWRRNPETGEQKSGPARAGAQSRAGEPLWAGELWRGRVQRHLFVNEKLGPEPRMHPASN